MSSVADICNLALAHIGEKPDVVSISPPDDTANAQRLARFYPIARDATLEPFAWDFALRRVSLAELSDPPDSWSYSYGYPTGCLRVLKILMPESTDDTASQDYTIETLADGNRVIYTNVEDAVVQYIHQVTDTSKFTALFVEAVAWLLGHYMIGIKDVKLQESCFKMHLFQLGRAKEANANAKQSNPYTTAVPSAILARR